MLALSLADAAPLRVGLAAMALSLLRTEHATDALALCAVGWLGGKAGPALAGQIPAAGGVLAVGLAGR